MISSHGLPAGLLRLVPPPSAPVDAHGDWTAAEAQLGVRRLPADFKALVTAYGRGTFCDTVCLMTPFGDDNPVPLTADLLEDYGPLRETNPGGYPYPLFPEPGGLLAWAVTDAGHHLCWLTEGDDPGTWPVVIWSRDDDYERFGTTAAGFLAGWADGSLSSGILTRDSGLSPWFDAAIPRDHVYVTLGPGEPPYDHRLAVLREALAPTVSRGTFRSPYDGSCQDHFATTDTDWHLTYETAYGHRLRVAFPPADSARARAAVLDAVARTGCAVLAVRTIAGESVWELPEDPGPRR
ncbi:SMI1/KNR4 family protein [Streptomyces sp. NPDC008001]|uniref:SMI1/KNR4 family protein n=1 Tax=Streptomyces sp. NPDC008001 TaxID=3364804 RepID=UPI0036E6DCF6